MKWNWHRFSDKKPRMGDEVLVCFEPGNPYSCDVVSLEWEDDELKDRFIWLRLDKTYEVDDEDYWTEIDIPIPDHWVNWKEED